MLRLKSYALVFPSFWHVTPDSSGIFTYKWILDVSEMDGGWCLASLGWLQDWKIEASTPTPQPPGRQMGLEAKLIPPNNLINHS